jgi:biopolymer transport protein TolQ
MAALFVAAMREWKRSHEGARPAIGSLRQRIDRVMDVTIQREAERLEGAAADPGDRGIGGAVHRPVRHGLGHHDRFQAIAASESTNLAVVAPGIAEALFATALWAFWPPFPR